MVAVQQLYVPPGFTLDTVRSYAPSALNSSSNPIGITFTDVSGQQLRPTYVSLHLTGNSSYVQVTFSGTKEQPTGAGIISLSGAQSPNPLSGAQGYLVSVNNSSFWIFDEDNAPTGVVLNLANSAGNNRIEIIYGKIRPLSLIRGISHPGIFKV